MKIKVKTIFGHRNRYLTLMLGPLNFISPYTLKGGLSVALQIKMNNVLNIQQKQTLSIENGFQKKIEALIIISQEKFVASIT